MFFRESLPKYVCSSGLPNLYVSSLSYLEYIHSLLSEISQCPNQLLHLAQNSGSLDDMSTSPSGPHVDPLN